MDPLGEDALVNPIESARNSSSSLSIPSPKAAAKLRKIQGFFGFHMKKDIFRFHTYIYIYTMLFCLIQVDFMGFIGDLLPCHVIFLMFHILKSLRPSTCLEDIWDHHTHLRQSFTITYQDTEIYNCKNPRRK